MLEGDAGKLAQALGYLLDNAIKFTHQGGVTLRVARENASGDDLALRIEVEDTGIGFQTPPTAPSTVASARSMAR